MTSLELGNVLGTGAFGTVYKGYWTPEGDPNRYEVAIKVLNEGTATSDAQMELLQVYLMHTFNSWCVCVCMYVSVYTNKSDVWSFGVTIWEILTCGRLPYEGKNGNQVVQLMMNGQQLEQPATCAADLYRLLGQ